MMEKKIAKNFNDRVEQLFPDDEEREDLYSCLRSYHRSHDLQKLVTTLKILINEPRKMRLYEEIKPLIPLKHQMDYDSLIPKLQLSKIRVIRLKRKGHDGLGFAVRGGLEHGVGVYVSHVIPDSQAYKQGLRAGDEILRLNGFTISQAIHEEVLNLIKAKRELVLKVRNVGMIPVKEHPNQKLHWKYVDSLDRNANGVPDDEIHKSDKKSEIKGRPVELTINVGIGMGLGCSVCSGPPELPGIFIQSVREGGLADEAGLSIGDQILAVNGTSFINIKHSEAVVALKGSRQLKMSILRAAGGDIVRSSGAVHRDVLSSQLSLHSPEPEEPVMPKQRLYSSHKNLSTMVDDQQPGTSGLSVYKGKQRSGSQEDVANVKRENKLRSKSAQHNHTLVQEDLVHQALEDIEQKERELGITADKDAHVIPHEPTPEEQPPQPAKAVPQTSQQHKTALTRQNNALIADFRAHFIQDVLPKDDNVEFSYPDQEVSSTDVTQQPTAIMSQDFSTDSTNNNDYGPIEVHIEESQKSNAKSSLSPKSPVYMRGGESKPAFRFQKPVLLHATKGMEARRPGSSHMDEELSEDNFSPYRMFTNEQIAGRQVRLINIRKEGCADMGIAIDGGQTGPKSGKVIVAEVYEGGAIEKQGGVHAGDQLLMVDWAGLTDISLAEAHNRLATAFRSPKATMQLVVAKAPPKAWQQEVTYF